MTPARKLSDAEVETRLSEIPGWELVDGKLHRELCFADFVEAFGFMTRLALVAEKHDHHPDWSNSWNKVRIDLTTHSLGGISENDFTLAHAANALAP